MLILTRHQGTYRNAATAAAHRVHSTLACVDLRNANDLAEIAAELLAQITVPKNLLKRERMLAIGRNTLAPIELAGGSFILSVDSRQDGATNLGQVLDWMNSFAESEEMKTTVLLQEVDQLERIWGPRGDWWLRGTTQFHRSLNYVFLSSKKRLGNWAIDPRRGFFGQLELLSF
jgi:hypothetical protein